jgi:hypothetical protein
LEINESNNIYFNKDDKDKNENNDENLDLSIEKSKNNLIHQDNYNQDKNDIFKKSKTAIHFTYSNYENKNNESNREILQKEKGNQINSLRKFSIENKKELKNEIDITDKIYNLQNKIEYSKDNKILIKDVNTNKNSISNLNSKSNYYNHNENTNLNFSFNKSVKEICIQYIFLELLYNLIENSKICYNYSKFDFIKLLEEEIENDNKNKNNNLYDQIKEIIEITILNDFDENNIIIYLYEEYEILRKICNEIFQSFDLLKIFKIRFLLNYFYLKIKDKDLYYLKNKNGKIKYEDTFGDSNNKNNIYINNMNNNIISENSNNFNSNIFNDTVNDLKNNNDNYDDNNFHSYNFNLRDDEIILYSKNLINKEYLNEYLEIFKENKIILSNDFINCQKEDDLDNLLRISLNYDGNIIDNQKHEIFIFKFVSKYHNHIKENNSNFNNLSNDNHKQKGKNLINEDLNEEKTQSLTIDEEVSLNYSFNESFSNIKNKDFIINNENNNKIIDYPQEIKSKFPLLKKFLKLNLINNNEYSNIFYLNKFEGEKFEIEKGKENYELKEINKFNRYENKKLKFSLNFFFRNNLFFRINKVSKKSKLIDIEEENMNLNKNNDNINLKENKSKCIIYYEVELSQENFKNISKDYKNIINKYRKKLSYIDNLEYENDHIYLFEFLQTINLNKEVIDIIRCLNSDITEYYQSNFEDREFFRAQNLFYLAESYNKLNDFDNALKYHEESLSIKKLILNEDHPDYVLSLNNLSSLYFSLGNYKSAERYYLECKLIEEKFLCIENDPNLAITYNNLATVYNKLNNLEEALKFYFKSIEIEKNYFGEKSLECATTFNNIGIIYDNLKEYENAIKFFLKSCNIREEISDEFDEELGICYNNLAVAFDNKGDYQKSLLNYNKSLDILKNIYDGDHPDVKNVFNYIECLKEKIEFNK